MSIAVSCSTTKRITTIKKSNLTSDGSEQTMLEFRGVGRIFGLIDFSVMVAEDTVLLRQYFKILQTGNYQKYAEETYVGVQENPLIYVTPKETEVALKITLQQTTGLPKRYFHNFMKEL